MNKKITYYSIIVVLIIVGIIGSLKIEKYESGKNNSKTVTQESGKLDVEMDYSSDVRSNTQQTGEKKSSSSNANQQVSKQATQEPININTATYLEIRERGFSVNVSQRIAYYCALHGGISDWKELDGVNGIGAKSLLNLQSKFTLTPITMKPQKFSLSEMNENLWYAMGLSRKEVKAIEAHQTKQGAIMDFSTLEKIIPLETVTEIKPYFND